ncbi:MAG TPA: hypothetical protein VKZ53_26215 [Candidatus Angelobacter sp.]|nr:hypothetical protein [Candidatus Angelobacter sp.]
MSALQGVQSVLDRIEGDLTRIVVLSTFRDNNTGSYYHPHLSPIHGFEPVDRAIAICHRDVFLRLVKAPVRQYVKELELYIQYANVDVVPAWRELKPYRGTIPFDVPNFLPEIYFQNIETALILLKGAS